MSPLDHFRTAFACCPDPCFLLNHQYEIVASNKRASTVLVEPDYFTLFQSAIQQQSQLEQYVTIHTVSYRLTLFPLCKDSIDDMNYVSTCSELNPVDDTPIVAMLARLPPLSSGSPAAIPSSFALPAPLSDMPEVRSVCVPHLPCTPYGSPMERRNSSTPTRKSDVSSAKQQATLLLMSQLTDELRTPLCGCLGLLDLSLEAMDKIRIPSSPHACCQDEQRTNNESLSQLEEVKSHVSGARAAAAILLSSITDMLEFARLERRFSASGVPVLRKHNFSVVDLIQDTISSFSFAASSKTISVDVRVADSCRDLVLCGDASRLRQLLSILIGNAIKFNVPEGRVEIECFSAPVVRSSSSGSDKYAITFVIRDTGIGICAAKVPHIFEPFYQAAESLARDTYGIGLGLPIAKGLCDIMGGRIALKDTFVGHGSTFEFTVCVDVANVTTPVDAMDAAAFAEFSTCSSAPSAMRELSPPEDYVREKLERRRRMDEYKAEEVHRQAKAKETEQEKPKSILLPEEKIRVLVAEDNAINQKIVRRMLEAAGYQVTMVENGVEAVEAVRNSTTPFDVAILDFQMPVMDGREAAVHIRALPDSMRAKLPLICFSAHTLESDRDTFFEAGMDAFIAKPASRDVLDAAIRRVIACHKDRTLLGSSRTTSSEKVA